MSFEGYFEFRCKQKHLGVCDAYDAPPERCDECGQPWTESRLVDQTNDPTVYGRWSKIRRTLKDKD